MSEEEVRAMFHALLQDEPPMSPGSMESLMRKTHVKHRRTRLSVFAATATAAAAGILIGALNLTGSQDPKSTPAAEATRANPSVLSLGPGCETPEVTLLGMKEGRLPTIETKSGSAPTVVVVKRDAPQAMISGVVDLIVGTSGAVAAVGPVDSLPTAAVGRKENQLSMTGIDLKTTNTTVVLPALAPGSYPVFASYSYTFEGSCAGDGRATTNNQMIAQIGTISVP